MQILEKHTELDAASLRKSLPEGFRVITHPESAYLDAPAPEIDMSANFPDGRIHVEEGMKVARRALYLAEAAIAGRK